MTIDAKITSRSYDAGSTVARYGDLVNSSGSADYELANALVPLRNKARNLHRNSPAQRRYVQLMRVNVCGENGFRLQSRVRMATNESKLDRSLNRRVEDEWNTWWSAPTVDGQMTGLDLEKQAVASWCNDGEVIWEIVYGQKYPSGIAINPIEPDMLDETLITTNPSTGNEIRMGVEVNRDGKPVAYWFLTDHPGDLHGLHRPMSRNRHRRITADRVLHLFDRVRAGQTRGEPPAAPVIHPVKMLDGYREAEVMGRRLRAAIMGFFTKDAPVNAQIDSLADRETEGSSDDFENTYEMDITPGTLKSLPYGYDFKQFDPGGVMADYHDFEGQIKKDQAMGYGISTFSHGMETEGVSYSTGRSVLTEDRDHYKQMQAFFSWLYRRVFKMWIGRQILQDDSQIPATRVIMVVKKFVVRMRGWDWVDPAKEVSANSEALRTKQTSLTRVAAARGIDISDLLDEIQEEQMLAEERGLTLDYNGGTVGQPNEGDEDDD